MQNCATCVSTKVGDHFESPQDAELFRVVEKTSIDSWDPPGPFWIDFGPKQKSRNKCHKVALVLGWGTTSKVLKMLSGF